MAVATSSSSGSSSSSSASVTADIRRKLERLSSPQVLGDAKTRLDKLDEYVNDATIIRNNGCEDEDWESSAQKYFASAVTLPLQFALEEKNIPVCAALTAGKIMTTFV